MQIDISKACSDFLRSDFAAHSGEKLKASHARELVAAFFGYKSHAALLMERGYPLSRLEDAAVLVPDIALIDARRANLEGLPENVFSSNEIASRLAQFLKSKEYFGGEIWLYESLGAYVREVFLIESDWRMMDLLSGVMAETNAYFDVEVGQYETDDVVEHDDAVIVEVEGQYSGRADTERPFCGDTIDLMATVEMSRVAGRTAFGEPAISARGEVNDDWVDPELKYATP